MFNPKEVWATKQKMDQVDIINKNFIDSLEPGLLYRPVKSFFLMYCDPLLDLLDSNGYDFSNVTVEDFEHLLNADEGQDIFTDITPPSELWRDYREKQQWFFLVSTSIQVMWVRRVFIDFKTPRAPSDNIEGYRLIESLCGEKRVFVCYDTQRLSLIENELICKIQNHDQSSFE